MESNKERYFWKRGRVRKLANTKAGVTNTSKKLKQSTKLESYVESISLTMDRKKANLIHKARREAREGKTVPLRSL